MRASTVVMADNHRLWHSLAVIVFVGILVLHGTYIRSRSAEDVPTADWLVMARLLACTIGLVLGLMMIPRILPLGFGAKMLLLYGLATVVSAARCPYQTTVLGYSGLLLGATVLTMALAYNAKTVPQLCKIEKLWYLTIGALIVKDAIIGLMTPQTMGGEDVGRLGINVTHPTELSLMATLVFWLSFTKRPEKYAFAKWLLRAFMVFVIVAAKTRISIIAFVMAGFVRFIVTSKDPLRRLTLVSGIAGTLLTFLLLNVSFRQPWATQTVGYFQRGQDKAGLATLTSRTLIWHHVVPKTLETPIIGHGYGVSRLTMGRPRDAGFQPLHCHNALLEVFFSTGLVGLLPFVLALVYSLKWIWDYPRLREVFSTDLALRGVSCVVVLLASSQSEAILGVKLSPIQPLLFLYLFILDRSAAFAGAPVPLKRQHLSAKNTIARVPWDLSHGVPGVYCARRLGTVHG